ncbi:MAG: epoxyqueuosine reductase QueH [Firmicutes bacterium]|nr:epoxyqueuosine reductase QueH [Bacillota bacterium]
MDEILLHACCGPCSTFSTAQLLTAGIRPVLFFANPNIHPYREYEARREAFLALARLRGLPAFLEPDYEPEEFFRRVSFHEEDRCRHCYELRLTRAATKAHELGLTTLSTTLLLSPYQNRELLLAVGEKVAAAHGLKFLAADWRAGFRAAQDEAARLGLYRQKYCGCLYSERERSRKTRPPGKGGG